MQNGCGNMEQWETQFGRERTFGARVITGFEITQTCRGKHYGESDRCILGFLVNRAGSPAICQGTCRSH